MSETAAVTPSTDLSFMLHTRFSCRLGSPNYNEVHPHKAVGYRSPREFILTVSGGSGPQKIRATTMKPARTWG
jgi:transposase InsO family protein